MGGMAGPANLHQIRYLVSGLLREMEERIEMRVQGVAEEVAEMRKESMRSRIDGRVVGHGMWCGSDQAGGRPLQGGGPLNSLDLVTIGASGEEQVRRQDKVSSHEKEMQRMVAEVKEGVEQMGADRVMSDGVMSEQLRELDGVMSEQLRELRHVSARMEEQEAVVGQRLGEVGQQVQHCVLELDRLPARLESVPEQLVLLGQRLDGEMLDMRDDMRDVRG